MAFITIVRARDDGDYESVAALSTSSGGRRLRRVAWSDGLCSKGGDR